MITTTPSVEHYGISGTRLMAGEYPGTPDEVTTLRRLDVLLRQGVDVMVDLTGPDDGLTPYAPMLRQLARGRSVERLHAPVPDFAAPDAQHVRRILAFVDEALATGRTVYVHCHGGTGRTGSVVGCWLVRHGRTPDEALAEIARGFASLSEAKRRRHPRGTPETDAQRALIHAWGALDARVASAKREAASRVHADR